MTAETASNVPVRLSPRETEWLRLRASGWSLQEMQRIMGVTRHTLYAYRANIAAKLGTSQTLVDMLRAVGWLTVPEA